MKIIVYTIPTCDYCKNLKTWLKRKRLAFEERDTFEEDKFRDELLEKSSQLGVPVTDIDGQIILGFHEGELQEAINKAKQ